MCKVNKSFPSILKKILSSIFILLLIPSIKAEDINRNEFYKAFVDSTLRIDYIFAGGPEGNKIFLSGQTKQNGWHGRHSRLKETPVKGNGNILVLNPETGDTLYNNSFSTLFQEWLSTPESKINSQSFENSFLVPLPSQDADIKLTLRNNKGEEIVSLTHKYKQDDLLVRKVKHSPLPFEYLHKGTDSERAIDLAILAEGYTAEEMDKFLESAKKITTEILSYEPFASRKDNFNIIAVLTPSTESGVSIPKRDEWKETRYDSHFSTFYSDRYLTSPRVWKMHRDLEGIPYEAILMIVNTSEYGGGGIFNSYQIAPSDNQFTLPVSVHEFGHSFGGLADEYNYDDSEDMAYPDGIEPWEKNITTLTDFDSKWKNQLTPGIQVPTPQNEKPREEMINVDFNNMPIGVYEGAGYRKTGVYRPSETCRMRDNYFPKFCKVCETSLIEILDFYTN